VESDDTPALDVLDETMVRMYRGGLIIAASAVLVAGGSQLVFALFLPHFEDAAHAWMSLMWVVLVYGVGIAVLNLHIYSKRARWGIQGAAWLGVLLMLAASVMSSPTGSWWVFHGGLALVFGALSGLVLKERSSTSLPGLPVVPVVLGASLVPLVAGWGLGAGPLLLVAGIPLAVLALAKYRKPLAFDVGDKTRYEV